MALGFTEIVAQDVFSPALNAIIKDLIPWIHIAQYTWVCKTATKAGAEWMCTKGQAFLHRLLSIPALSPEDSTVTPARRHEECCRYVLIILLSYVTTQMAWRSGKMNVTRLQTALLQDYHDWGSPALNKLLLWILMCGSFVAEDDTVEHEWFLDRAVHVAGSLGLCSLDKLNELLEQFFFPTKLQYSSLRELVDRKTLCFFQAESSYSTRVPGAREYDGRTLQ